MTRKQGKKKLLEGVRRKSKRTKETWLMTQSKSARANTFDFLGITHYGDISRRGKFKVGRRTSQKRFARSSRAMNQWLKSVRSIMKTREWWPMLIAKMRGHYQYYGISENSQSINGYYYRVRRMVFKWLNRRNQKKRLVWEQFKECLKLHPLPKPRIMHSFYTWSHA